MRAFLCLLLVGSAACASAPSRTTSTAPARDSAQAEVGRGGVSIPNADPFPSSYVPFPSRTTVIRNVNILTAAGPLIRNGAILMQNGKIAAVGATVNAPADAIVLDGAGKYVTPGIIDDHSHLGVYAAPGGNALSDGNEATSPSTPQVWAEHSVWPQDPQFPRNLAGGVTTLQVLPGSANLIGGRSVVLKVVPGRTVQAMMFPGA
jgi:imidazolonepropionase-like amidohydrolase